LDYYRQHANRARQRQALEDQLEVAGELGLPVIIHNRQAMEDLIPILEAWRARFPGAAGILHAYSGDREQAQRAARAGLYFGVGGAITFKNAEALRQVIVGLPPERIVLETDAPYLTPHPYRGKRNEPANVRLVAESLAGILGLDAQALADVTDHNVEVLLG
jgi:TatD DNase family protein